MTVNEHTMGLSADIYWFDVAEQPEISDCMPTVLTHARRLSGEDHKTNELEVLRLLAPFVKANFSAGLIHGWQGLFLDKEGSREIVADFRLTDVDFSAGAIPRVGGFVNFGKIRVHEEALEVDLQAWELSNGQLDHAITCYWSLPGQAEWAQGLNLSNRPRPDEPCERELGEFMVFMERDDGLIL